MSTETLHNKCPITLNLTLLGYFKSLTTRMVHICKIGSHRSKLRYTLLLFSQEISISGHAICDENFALNSLVMRPDLQQLIYLYFSIVYTLITGTFPAIKFFLGHFNSQHG